MVRARTTVLMTDDGISHGLVMNNAFHKTTTCGRTFVSWVKGTVEKHGPWLGIEEPLPTLRKGMVDCMTCIVQARAP
jgi:hypothetical protein